MSRPDVPAPGSRGSGRPGALLFPILLVALLAACDERVGERGRTVIELEDGETVELDDGAVAVDVVLLGAGRAGMLADTVRIRPGDVVRFVAGDPMPHAVVFDASLLPTEAAAFLERSGQLRGPPLVETGASWIVSFDGAPPGAYPFADLSQDVHGVVLVAAPTSP